VVSHEGLKLDFGSGGIAAAARRLGKVLIISFYADAGALRRTLDFYSPLMPLLRGAPLLRLHF